VSAPRVLLSGIALAQPMGGVVRHNQELLPRLARLLDARGGSLAVLEGAQPISFELPPEVERIRSRVPAQPVWARAAAEGRALGAALSLAAERGEPFDLVHTAHLPAPRHLDVPLTLTLHDLKSLGAPGEPLARRLFGPRVVATAVRRAALVIAVSEVLKGELVQRFELDPARVRVVPNAGDHLAPRPRTGGQSLLYVGHVEPRKNLDVVLRALALDLELPDLEIAGAERGHEGQRLRSLARELGVDARVRFLGEQDDQALARLYARARAVVLPSRRESFGIPILEAQLARAPLAISDLPALAEIAGPDVPRFAPLDPASCARALRAALATPEHALDDHARRAARFTWDRSAALWLQAFEAVDSPG
jgi:glycosyltransferase involved in cell wall biosynthesis